jgi:hypothetical protein
MSYHYFEDEERPQRRTGGRDKRNADLGKAKSLAVRVVLDNITINVTDDEGVTKPTPLSSISNL